MILSSLFVNAAIATINTVAPPVELKGIERGKELLQKNTGKPLGQNFFIPKGRLNIENPNEHKK